MASGRANAGTLRDACKAFENVPAGQLVHAVEGSSSWSDSPGAQPVQLLRWVEPAAAYVPLGQLSAHSPMLPGSVLKRPAVQS